MGKTKFNILHKHTIVVNNIKYKILQSKDKSVCQKCDCFGSYIGNCCMCRPNVFCTKTIGRYGYLKRINHKK